MDLMQLAGASNPGQALPGMEWDQIRRYQNLNTINQSALQQAMPVAQSNAQRELQTNEEWNLAAPGRLDTISLGNKSAAANLDMFDETQAIKKMEMAVKNRDLAAQLRDYTKDIGQWGDAYVTAKTDEERAQVLASVPKGIKLADGYEFGSDPAKDRTLLYGAGKARASAAGVQVKRDVEETKQAGSTARLIQKQVGDVGLAQLKGEIARELQDARLAQSQNKPLTASQAEALAVEKVYGDDEEGKLKYWYTKNQLSGSTSVAGGRAATIENVTQGKVKAQGAQVQEPPKANKDKKDPKLGDIWGGVDKFNNPTKRKITGIGRDKTTNKILQLQLEDGTVVDYK